MVMLHALDEDDGPIPELVDESESEDDGETITGGCSTNRMLLSMHNVMHQVTRVSIINESGRHFTAPYYSGLHMDVAIQGQDGHSYNTICRAMEQHSYHSYSRVDAINYAVVQPRRMNEGDAFVAQFDEGDDACMPELVDDDDEEALGPVRPYGEVLSSFHVDFLAHESSFMVTAWQKSML